ncbi:MAG: energy transducer TonB [Leptospiraceae bacterium]|nr:energy transducer TonB [Leptospiraceae bacterium]MCP5510408.1 energy transducer TonB [Leptospiraceae bacterium]
MQAVKKIYYSETLSPFSKLVTALLVFAAWLSPMIGYEIFFPLALLFLYRINHTIRAAAFQVLVFQAIIALAVYPSDLICMYNSTSKACIGALKSEVQFIALSGFWLFVGLLILFFEARTSIRRFGYLNKQDTSTGFAYFFLRLFLSLLSAVLGFILINLFFGAIYYYFNSQQLVGLDGEINVDMVINRIFRGDSALYLWFLNLHSASRTLGRKKVLAILRKPFLALTVQQKLIQISTTPGTEPFLKKSRFAKVRQYLLPGWGLVYLNRYWLGFSSLFVFLLLILFAATAWIYHLDYSFGTNFLLSLGLKPGIPDKQFIFYTSHISTPLFATFSLVLFYIFSQNLLRTQMQKDEDPPEKRGLQTGFKENFSLSFLIHLILISVIFIIPVMLKRNTSDKKKSDLSKTHFQPEKMEFYFIDPEIPDEVKDLNGGVISGTETPNKQVGEEIPDETVTEEGKVKGYVKRIKGKKLPKTYSNYISARMRGPEMFMEYWKRAPHPYSCVVAYTITTEGEITDVTIVESSDYPEQDQLTIELIESMSPVMPPPGVKGDVRVTELFWNGSIDPDSMPTQLQKEMVLMFDGRYMEEDL